MAKKAAAPLSDFEKQLGKASSAWDAARERAASSKGGGGFGEYDDGKYMVRLQKAFGATNTKGAYLQFDFKFLDDPYKGMSKALFQNMQTDENLFHAARLLGQFGYELPEKVSDIVAVLEAISAEKPLCRITIKTKGEYQNVYLDKVIQEEADEDAAEEEDDAEAVDGDEEEDATEDEEAEDEDAEDEDADEESDDEEEADEDEEAEIEVGMRVEAETAKGTRTGTVHALDEAEGLVKIRDAEGKIFKVAVDKVSILAEVPATPPPTSKSKIKTPAAAPAPAPKSKSKK